MGEIEKLAKALQMSDKTLERMRRQYRMEHGAEAEAKLMRWLSAAHEEHRDRVRLMGKAGGYVESFAGSLQVKGVEAEPEPECVSAAVQDEYSRNGWHTTDILKGEEKAIREARSRAERLRQAELDLRKAGKSHEHHAQTIDRAIEAMRLDAKAA